MTNARMIGPLGTLARSAVGFGLIVLAVVPGGLTWPEVALGMVGIPAALLLLQGLRLRFSDAPLRATGPAGHLVNCAILAALLVPSATREAALIWLGSSMVLAAWRGYAGCESLAFSNWLLRRDDQVGCLLFSPLDELEAQLTGRKIAGSAR
jgi:hypothetical protein